MAKKVLFIASNYGLWAEELQGPWDAVRKAGLGATLATYKGLPPLPVSVSLDADFVDPVQNLKVNSAAVVERCKEIIAAGEWNTVIKTSDAKMADYDAIALIGGPGAPLDVNGSLAVHNLVLDAYRSNKLVAALCYAVGTLAFVRNPANGKSILYGKHTACHPRSWDFNFDLPYILSGTTPENRGTDIVTPGGVYPLQYLIEDAVGEKGKVFADPTTSREKPCVVWDKPILTGLSLESSAAFGAKIVEILSH